MGKETIERLRQNAVNLISKDQSVRQLADIVAELCMICERQQRQMNDMKDNLNKLNGNS